jgi:hypothetical protein
LSSLPHIRKQQLAERKRKSEARESQLAPKPTSVKSKRSHPLLIAQDRKKAQEEEEASRLQADQFDGTVKEKELQKPSFMSQRKWDDIPVSQRSKVLANIKKTEEKAAIKSGALSPILKEVSQILSAASPISWEDPNKYTMLGGVDTSVRKELGLASPKGDGDPSPNVGPDKELEQKPVTKEKLAKLDAIDKKLKAESGETETVEKTDLTNTDGGLMKKPEAPTTGEVTEEPLKFDKNGYPIYHKDSKKAAEWNKAYADAEPGNFMWDGREYVKEGKPEDQEAAVAVRQSYDTGDANLAEASYRAPEKAQPMAQGEWETSEEQAKDKYSPEKIAEDIIKINEDTNFTPHDSEKLIKKKVKPLNKEDTADAKEKSGKGRWYIDPWTGFAIDLNKLQKRQDRKDAMEFAALLPADQRAAYLSQEELIEPEDLKKLLEPSELEQLQLQQAEIAVKTASYNLVTAELKRKDYRTPEQIADAELKKTIAAEKRAETTAIAKHEREKTVSNKAEMDRYAGLFKNAIKYDDFAGQVYWGEKMNLPRAEMVRIAKSRAAWELKQEKTKTGTSPFKEIFEFPYKSVVDSRQKLLMGTASLWTTGSIDIQIGNKQVKSREGLLNTLGIEDYDDMTAEDVNGNPLLPQEEAIRMISSQSDLSIFKNEDYQDADGNPDWLSILNDEDIYKRFVLDNAIYKGMNAMHGGEYADILTYEAKRREKRHRENKIFRQKVTTNQK